MPAVRWRLLHLLVMATMAITQPLLNVLGENPTFFVAHSASAGQILGFAAIVSLVPAAALGALMLAGHAISTEAGERVFSALMTVLAFVFVLQVVDAMPGPAMIAVAVAALVSYGLMVLYATRRPVRTTVSLLTVFPVAVVALFLFISPTSSIVFPDDVQAVALDDLLGADFAVEGFPAGGRPEPADPAPADPAPADPAPADAPPVSSAPGDRARIEPTATPAATVSEPPGPAAPGTAGTSSAAAGPAPTGAEPVREDVVRPASVAERLNGRFPPIYILVLDELPWASLLDRSGRIDPVRFPNFARLAARSHVFSNATTVAFTTELAVPALLTGTLETQPAPVFSFYPNNLFTLLGGVYDVSASDPLVDLCPPSVCDGSPPARILELIAAEETDSSAQQREGPVAATTTATAAPVTTTPDRTIDNPPTTVAAVPPTTTEAVPTTTAAAIASTAPTAPEPADATTGRERGSLTLMLKDAAIVFAHLASPDGVDFGLPSIGATWGSFGRGPIVPALAVNAEPDSAPALQASTARTATTAPPATTAPATAATAHAPATTTTPTTTGPSTTAVTHTTAAASTTTASAETTPPAADPVAELSAGADMSSTPTGSDPVDPQLVAEERMAFLDSLIATDNRVADFRAEIATMAASELPRLHYLHSLLPHVPWKFRPDGSTYADIALPGYFSQWDEDPAKAHFGQQRHLLQLGMMDRLLGEYLDRLEAIGDFDRSFVIVTADHGISFVPGERSRGIGDANVGGIANVPLLYKEPGQRTGTAQTRPVQLIDIVPTIAAQLELDPPWTFDGRDMFAAEPAGDRRVQGPYGAVDVPEDLATIVEAIAAGMHNVFGDGSSGSLYGLGGAHSLIGTPARNWTTDPSEHCWILERPAAAPDVDGGVGYVYGRTNAPAGAGVAVALSIDGVVAGTARSYRDGSVNRVYVIGDPQFWRAGQAVAELHEIVGGRLAPISRC